MKSLFAKILAWFGCTMLITLVGSAFISALSMNPNENDERAPWSRLMRFQLEEARTAYETGGRPELEAYLDTLHRSYDARGILADEKGRDVLTGEDRSNLVRRARLGAPRFTLYRFIPVGVATLARASDDGRYWFFFIVPRNSLAPSFLTAEHLFFLAAAVLLCYWLTYHLTRPVADLQKAKEMAGQRAKGLEEEMRSDLESKDVTISNLQGKLTVTILDRVMFDSGEAILQPDGEAVLRKIAAILAGHPELKIHVVGHTDNVPIHTRFASNWELSTARALAAVHFFTEKAGVDPRRVGAVGYGEFRPIADNSTPEGRAKNRRIAITILPDELAGADTVPTIKTNAAIDSQAQPALPAAAVPSVK